MRVAARNKWLLAAALLLSLSAARAAPRGRLLRVPKVYNALITSNEPLLPSRTEQATVGQVLYYPPHHTYPASSGPLILPQVTPHQPPLLYDPSQPQQQQQGQQQLESLPQDAQQEGLQGGQPLELHVQPGLTQEQVALAQEQDQSTPWPVVYASDVQQQQQQQQTHSQQQQLYPQQQQTHPQQLQLQQQQLPQDAAGLPSAPFPAARAVQTVEEVAHPGEYQPPPAVDIDSIKNNRPSGEGIRDVPPPPLPVGRGNKDGQPLPPGLLPF